MYCECKISHNYYGDVEHIRPKSIYPEFEFDWNNLGFVCAKCNGHKRNKFDEEVPFVNPYDEDPSDFITAVGSFLWQRAGSERGELTIAEIALNRPHLLERRTERMKMIGALVDKIERTQNETLKLVLVNELKKEIADCNPYAMVAQRMYQNLTE